MTGLLRRREFLTPHDLKPRYDVVIVGGGVNGLSLAFHLAEYHGIRDVAVLERSYIGSGGSGRNTQVVRATYNTTETVPLYATSLGMYRTLSQELDFNVLFSTQGNLDLCHSTDTLQVEREKVLLHRQYGVDTEILTPEQVLAVCPLVDLTAGGELPVIGASYHPPGAFARHDSVVWGYASAANRRGVEIHQGVEVVGVDVVDGECRGVVTNRGPVAAGTGRERGRRVVQRGRAHGGRATADRDDGAAGVRDRGLHAGAVGPRLLDGPVRVHAADRSRRDRGRS